MAGPSEVLARGRRHREIENRVHYVRDFSYDEDRGRIRKGRLSRNLACLTNATISVVRLKGRFRHQPQANRHYAAAQDEALHEVPRYPTNLTQFVRDYARPSGRRTRLPDIRAEPPVRPKTPFLTACTKPQRRRAVACRPSKVGLRVAVLLHSRLWDSSVT